MRKLTEQELHDAISNDKSPEAVVRAYRASQEAADRRRRGQPPAWAITLPAAVHDPLMVVCVFLLMGCTVLAVIGLAQGRGWAAVAGLAGAAIAGTAVACVWRQPRDDSGPPEGRERSPVHSDFQCNDPSPLVPPGAAIPTLPARPWRSAIDYDFDTLTITVKVYDHRAWGETVREVIRAVTLVDHYGRK